jgi:hypothetical protein
MIGRITSYNSGTGALEANITIIGGSGTISDWTIELGSGAGTSGTSGTSGTIGPEGPIGPAGADGTSGTNGTSGTDGTSGTSGTDGTSGTSPEAQYSGSYSGSFEGDGSLLTGLPAGGVSTTYSPTVRYEALDNGNNGADGRVEILSTGTVYGGLTWSRSSTTLIITSENHGLSTGDYIVIQNMHVAYLYVSVTATDSNTLTCTVAATGGTSGEAGAYVPAFDATSFSQNGVTIGAPATGNCQVNSIQITTPTKTNSNFNLVMPSSISNGAGGNNSLYYQNPPLIQAWALSNGNQNTSAVITLNTSDNFNQFEVGGLASLVKSLIRLTF